MCSYVRRLGTDIPIDQAPAFDELLLEVQCACGEWVPAMPDGGGIPGDDGEWTDDEPGYLSCPVCGRGIWRWGFTVDAKTVAKFRGLAPGQQSNIWDRDDV